MIKNLLFDLGGVIMDIDKNRCVKAFDELGLKNASSYFGEYSQQGPFMALERGDIDAAEFHRVLRGGFDVPVTDGEIDRAFCRFLIGFLSDVFASSKNFGRSIRSICSATPIR